jgi:quinohemoprotein ethanol dehydrogenase
MKIVVPSFLGGHNWHPMSFHPGTGLVYLPAQETAPGGPQQTDVHAHSQRGEHRSGCAAVA